MSGLVGGLVDVQRKGCRGERAPVSGLMGWLVEEIVGDLVGGLVSALRWANGALGRELVG
jgi:hypothetical protein